MLQCAVLMFFLAFINSYTCIPIESKVDRPHPLFRNDYTFLESTQSFYKIHNTGRSWIDAKKTCSMEGATFFYPGDTAEATAIVELMNKTYPKLEIVYIGVSDLLSKDVFVTIDGKSLDDVFNIWAPGEPNDVGGTEDCVIMSKGLVFNDESCRKKFPYICKKTSTKLSWNTFCDTYDSKYLYEGGLGKCYKFHAKPMSWSDAYATCNAEQSYLAVINSKQEAEHFVTLLNQFNKMISPNMTKPQFIHSGFHNLYNDGWTTVQGTPIEESGYAEWAYHRMERNNCGIMLGNGQLNDAVCAKFGYFICEHDIDIKIPVNERISKTAKIEDVEVV